MGADIDLKVPPDAKLKATRTSKKKKKMEGKNVADTFLGCAQNLHEEHDIATSIPNVNTEGVLPRATDLMLSMSLSNEAFKSKILNAAIAAMNELYVKATKREPLWIANEDGTENLNKIEYMKEYQSDDLSFENLARLFETSENENHDAMIEVTREFDCVPMLRADIVNMLMDCELWVSNFCNIVSRAAVFGVLSSGRENYDGTLLMLTAEFHTTSPLIPTRESHLARYCRQLDQYTWGVVDISVENLIPSCRTTKFQRKPSGCLIMEIPGGVFSNVTWVEHCQADDCVVHHDLKHIVDAGVGFGARYWLSALSRYANWCNAVTTARTLSSYGASIPQEGRVSVLRLGERLLRSFFIDMSPSKFSIWMPSTLFDAKGIKVRRSKYNGAVGLPNGYAIAFATSFKLLVSPRRVFDHLSREGNRAKWDILSYGHNTRTLIRIPTSESSDHNCISILEVFCVGDCTVTYHLQNAYKDDAGAYVVYAPIDEPTVHHLLTGGNPDKVVILPSGFTVLPATITPSSSKESQGCLVTAGFHIMDEASPALENNDHISIESLEIVHKIVTETVEALMFSLYSNPPGSH